MKRRSIPLLSLFALACAALPALAQSPTGAWPPSRPMPDPLEVPRSFQRAVAAGTRTTAGVPGPRYWQQWANYRIRATVDPAAKTLTGSQTISYHNRSPDTLAVLVVKLWQNLHAPGVVRNEPNEVTGGVQLSRVAVAGRALQAGEGGYQVDGTNMVVRPPSRVLPGDSVRLEIDWSFKIPQAGASGRMGWDEDNLLYLAYWHPQMAVYDDVVGWHTDPFLGGAEFYMGYGNYEYTVDAPAQWVVMGTGDLTNAQAALAPAVYDRWRRAAGSDAVVNVLTPGDFGRATAAGNNGRVTWSFRADTVRDVAFSVTRESRWDAARTPVGDRNGDGRADYVLIQSFWRENAPRWQHSVRYGQQSIRFLSEFTGVRYPWPHMTAVEAANIIGGGMEYPMMTLIGSYNQAPSDSSLYSVTAHELAHMWVPMIVGTDETRYGWMDEGTTNFNENQAFNDFYAGAANAHLREQRQYVNAARAGVDTRLLTWTDLQPAGYGGFASYTKPAMLLNTLRGLLGEDTFNRAYRKYLNDWRFRHPKPWDFFNAFNTAAGRDLGWFWDTWYDEAWTLDQAVASVTAHAQGTEIVVEDRGSAPMPVRLLVTRQGGATERREVPVETWLSGVRRATVTVPAGSSPVVRVEIDPESHFPDVDRANNVWTSGGR